MVGVVISNQFRLLLAWAFIKSFLKLCKAGRPTGHLKYILPWILNFVEASLWAYKLVTWQTGGATDNIVVMPRFT